MAISTTDLYLSSESTPEATVSDSETSTLSHVSKTDTASLASTAVSTLVFESSSSLPSQHLSESISQNTEQGTITNTNAYFSTEKTSQSNLDTTTEEPEDDTVVTQITNGTVQCTCVCRTVNRTLEESIELRKKALSVKHKELSSNLRKLTSAPDFRPSSKAMGSFGVAVLITVAAVIFISDESIDKRKKKLIINKKELSSSIRKLTSAEDSRMSSKNIGVMESMDKRKKELIVNKKELSSSIRNLNSSEDSRVSSRNIGVMATSDIGELTSTPIPGSCTFSSHGTNTKGSTPYSFTSESFSDCQSRSTSDIGELTSTPIPGSCTFSSHGTNTKGSTPYSFTSESFSDCQSRCQLDTRCNGFTHNSLDNSCRLHETSESQSAGLCYSCTFVSKSCISSITTSDIGELTSTPIPGSCTFSSHGTNTKGSTPYSFTSESFSDCQSRCQLDTRCNGFTHNSLDNSCRLHETSESQSAGLCYSCTFVSKSCISSITTSDIGELTSTPIPGSCTFSSHGTNTKGSTPYSFTSESFSDCQSRCQLDTRCNGFTHNSLDNSCRLHETSESQSAGLCYSCTFVSKSCISSITTSDIGELTSTPIPGSCTFSSHGTNTKGSTPYSFTSESFSDCQSRCQLDTRCNGFTHNSLDNSCRLHETSESQSAGLCYSCTFVSKSCISSITTSDIGELTSTPIPGSCTFSSHGTNTKGSTPYSFTSESFSDCQSRCQLDTRCNGFTHNSLDNSCRLHETSESQSAGLCYSCTFVSKSCISSITTSDIGELTSTSIPESCTFSSHGTNTKGSTPYSFTSESFSDCQSRCQLDTRCNGFTHNSLDNSCRLHETSESQSAGLCYSCTFVSKSCMSSITTSDIGELTSTSIPESCTFSSHGTNTKGSTPYSFTSESFSDCQSRCQLDTRCNGFTHNSLDNSCRLHETSESQSAGLCYSCTFVSKSCKPSITTSDIGELTSTSIPESCTFSSHGTNTKGSTPYSFTSESFSDCQSRSTSDVGDMTSTPVPETCTFSSHGSNTRGSTHYSSTSESFSDCQSRCQLDTRCNGFTHNSRENNCRLHETSESQYTAGCDSCTFVSKSCTPSIIASTENPPVCSGVTFTDHGQQTKSPGYYRSVDSTDEASCLPLCQEDYLCRDFRFKDNKCDLSASDTSWQNLAYDECQTRCTNDVTCNGFTYRSDIQRCILTNTKISSKIPSCEFCSHYEKTCPSGFSTSCKTQSFLLHGFYYRYKVEIKETLANSWLHCRDLCAKDDICRDYRYNATTGICSRNTADYGAEIVRSLTECEKLCFTEPRCRSFLFRTDIKRCYISYTNASTAASWCETCAFSLKLCAEEDEETQDPEVYTDANIATCYDYHPRGFTVYSVDIYSSHNVSTWTKCESLCSGDDTCRSYSYDTGGAEGGRALKHMFPTERETPTLNILDTTEEDWDTFPMSSSLIAIDGTTSYSSQLPTETTTAANTPDSYSVTLNKEYTIESPMYQEPVSIADNSVGTGTALSVEATSSISSSSSISSVTSSEHTSTTAAIVDDSSPTLSVETLVSHSSSYSSPSAIEAELTSTTSPETLSEHVSGSTTNANTFSPSEKTAGAQVETTSGDTTETTYTSLLPESTTQHTVSAFDTSPNATISNEKTTQSIQHSSPEQKTILSESTSSTYVDFSSEVTSEPTKSDSTTNTQLLSSTGTSTNSLLDTTTEKSTSMAVSTTDLYLSSESTPEATVSDSETSTLSHVSKTDTASLASTAVSTLVFESSTPLPSQHLSESISQNTEQGTITNTNAYFSTEKTSQSNLDTTTEEPEDDTVVTQITNGTVQCTCVCRTVNRTLEESIELRKKALSVKHKELSSNLRKLTSAPDFRPSSKAMGSFGVAVLITVTAVIVISDESIDKRKKELAMNKKELSSSIRKLTSAEDSRVSSRNIGKGF
uniref:Mucin-17-like n=1 Tax=Crassostrea virginica TaxID=6565 RepID=A0A8B8CBG8_CRAVI|nr:mucin-17-like [Crassostrea virginica]